LFPYTTLFRSHAHTQYTHSHTGTHTHTHTHTRTHTYTQYIKALLYTSFSRYRYYYCFPLLLLCLVCSYGVAAPRAVDPGLIPSHVCVSFRCVCERVCVCVCRSGVFVNMCVLSR